MSGGYFFLQKIERASLVKFPRDLERLTQKIEVYYLFIAFIFKPLREDLLALLQLNKLAFICLSLVELKSKL